MQNLLTRFAPHRAPGRQAAVLFSSAALALGFLSFAAAQPCRGITLDWSLVSWPQNSLTNSFDIDATNPGNDVRITITGDTQYITGNNPQVDTQVTGGFGSGTQTLDLTTTFDTIYQSWTLTVEFLYSSGVTNVSFVVLDVDAVTSPPPQDQLRNIYATAVGSTNLIAPTIVGSADNVVAGSGVNQTVTGLTPNQQSSGDGNVYISYTNQPISSFTYTFGQYTNDPYSGRMVSQHNALYNITFSKPVPEVGVVLGPSMVLSLSIALLCARRFRAGRKPSR